jgi:hypothetical protein
MNLIGSLVSGAVVATVLWQAGSLRGGDAGLTLSYATQFVQALYHAAFYHLGSDLS